MTKYFKEKELFDFIGDIKIPDNFAPMSQDSYNEQAIGEAIRLTGKEPELLQATINVAVIGIGNQKYGGYRNGDNVIDISLLMINAGVKLRLPQGVVLKENDLTIQRLCRFFRFHIRKWLRASKYQTYIYRKYSDHNPLMNEILFRGAEYLDDLTDGQVAYLHKTYETMDTLLHTSLAGRFERIRQAQTGLRFVPG